MMHFVDKDGNVLRRNESSRSVLGHATKKSLKLADYVHPDDVAGMRVDLSRLFERGQVRDVRVRFISQDKKLIPVELRGVRASHRIGVLEARDRRQETELERRLNETEARYRFLIEDAVDTLDSGIIITDRQRHVVWANEAISRFFSMDRDELVGDDSLQALSRYVDVFEQAENVRKEIEEAIQKGEKIQQLQCRVRPGLARDERVLEYRSTPIETDRYKGGE